MMFYSLSVESSVVLIGFFSILIPLVICILFNVNMQSAMNAVSTKNRKMEGGLVWLNLIPVLNIVWPFIFNNALRVSYRNEFQEKGIRHNVNLISGLIYPGLQALFFLIWFVTTLAAAVRVESAYYSPYAVGDAYSMAAVMGVFLVLLGLSSLVLWIIFWVNVNGLKTVLLSRIGVMNHSQSPIDQVSFPSSHESARSNQAQTQYSNEQRRDSNPTVEPISGSIVKPQQPSKKVGTVEKLKKYHEMLEEGLITQADFDRIKKELLNQ